MASGEFISDLDFAFRGYIHLDNFIHCDGKLIAYEATWTQKIHQRRLGIHRFRVLTVTTVAARVKSLLEACSQLKRGHGLFLFADWTVLEKDPFSAVWRCGKSSETAGILDLPKMASGPVS